MSVYFIQYRINIIIFFFTLNRHTVRKKRSHKDSSKKGFITQTAAIREENAKQNKVESPKHSNHLPRKSSESNIRSKPEVAPRKFSSSSNSPPRSTSPKLPVKPMTSLGINSPLRPRQTLINRAYSTPNEEDREENGQNLSPHMRRRSPSPARKFSPIADRKVSPTPKDRKLSPSPKVRGLKNSDIGDGQSNGKESVANGLSTDNNPYTQQAAESLIKYVLASNDPNLKSALIKVVSSDPDILKALKN